MNKFSIAFIAAAIVTATSVSAQTEPVLSDVNRAAPNVVQQPAASGPVPASKQPVNSNWISGAGDTVWLNGSGERCVRSSFWTPETANKGCDGALVEVAPAAESTPAPVAAPIAGTSEKVTYQKEILFAFDKTTLTAEGKAQLDALVEEIKSLDNLETVILSGHTDEIGPNKAYNDKLGLLRTEEPKSYLMAKGLDEGKIVTESKGQNEPVVTNCREQIAHPKGKAQSKAARAKLISCLAPNRRVKIEAIGTSSHGQQQGAAQEQAIPQEPAIQEEESSEEENQDETEVAPAA